MRSETGTTPPSAFAQNLRMRRDAAKQMLAAGRVTSPIIRKHHEDELRQTRVDARSRHRRRQRQEDLATCATVLSTRRR
jgi:hypothetical protein